MAWYLCDNWWALSTFHTWLSTSITFTAKFHVLQDLFSVLTCRILSTRFQFGTSNPSILCMPRGGRIYSDDVFFSSFRRPLLLRSPVSLLPTRQATDCIDRSPNTPLINGLKVPTASAFAYSRSRLPGVKAIWTRQSHGDHCFTDCRNTLRRFLPDLHHSLLLTELGKLYIAISPLLFRKSSVSWHYDGDIWWQVGSFHRIISLIWTVRPILITTALQ